jgi:hypothetical protein
LAEIEKHMQKSKLSIGLLVLAVVMVTGSTFASPPPPESVPDASSSAMLMSLGCAALAAVRKLVR